jgi:hypothetical protein
LDEHLYQFVEVHISGFVLLFTHSLLATPTFFYASPQIYLLLRQRIRPALQLPLLALLPIRAIDLRPSAEQGGVVLPDEWLVLQGEGGGVEALGAGVVRVYFFEYIAACGLLGVQVGEGLTHNLQFVVLKPA